VRNYEVRNPRFYLSYGMSDEMSEYQKQVSRRLLGDFLTRADEALEDGSEIAADLRFGHDVGLLPQVMPSSLLIASSTLMPLMQRGSISLSAMARRLALQMESHHSSGFCSARPEEGVYKG
jgi:hypothetical protein